MTRKPEPHGHGDDAGSGLGAPRVEVAEVDSVLAYLAAVVELLDWVPPTTLPRREVIGGLRRKVSGEPTRNNIIRSGLRRTQ